MPTTHRPFTVPMESPNAVPPLLEIPNAGSALMDSWGFWLGVVTTSQTPFTTCSSRLIQNLMVKRFYCTAESTKSCAGSHGVGVVCPEIPPNGLPCIQDSEINSFPCFYIRACTAQLTPEPHLWSSIRLDSAGAACRPLESRTLSATLPEPHPDSKIIGSFLEDPHSSSEKS